MIHNIGSSSTLEMNNSSSSPTTSSHSQNLCLDEAFFCMILSNHFGDSGLVIKSISLDQSSKDKIHHYASSMLCIPIEFESFNTSRTSISVIVKMTPLQVDATVLKLDYSKTFDTEIRMYSEVIPAIEEILTSAGESFKLAPKLIYSARTPRPVLVLEDLCDIGYQVPKGFFDFYDTLLVVEKLARYHAASVVIKERVSKRKIYYENFFFKLRSTR